MGLFSGIFSLFSSDTINDDMFDDSSISNPGALFDDDNGINVANGLPMTNGIDIEGNPSGFDFSHDTFSDNSSSIDDSFSSCDDMFSSDSMFD